MQNRFTNILEAVKPSVYYLFLNSVCVTGLSILPDCRLLGPSSLQSLKSLLHTSKGTQQRHTGRWPVLRSGGQWYNAVLRKECGFFLPCEWLISTLRHGRRRRRMVETTGPALHGPDERLDISDRPWDGTECSHLGEQLGWHLSHSVWEYKEVAAHRCMAAQPHVGPPAAPGTNPRWLKWEHFAWQSSFRHGVPDKTNTLLRPRNSCYLKVIHNIIQNLTDPFLFIISSSWARSASFCLIQRRNPKFSKCKRWIEA